MGDSWARRAVAAGLSSIAVVSVVLVTGCGLTADPPAVADYRGFTTIDELVQTADVIVRGTAGDARVDELRPETDVVDDNPTTNPQAGLTPREAAEAAAGSAMIVTITPVQVSDVLKGTVTEGGTVEVSQLGGERDGERQREAHTVLLTRGSDYLLFLAAHGPGKPYDLLNPAQAMYTVTGDEALHPPGEQASPLATDLATVRSAVARLD